jgi:hypothetical protein
MLIYAWMLIKSVRLHRFQCTIAPRPVQVRKVKMNRTNRVHLKEPFEPFRSLIEIASCGRSRHPKKRAGAQML